MKIKRFLKENWFFIASAAAVIAVLITLNLLFNRTADDMEWGIKPFTFFIFTEFNGRYLGTLITLIITKVEWLRVVICAAVSFGVIYVLSLNGRGHKTFFFIMAAFLFAAMPLLLFREVAAWASGFANYMPAALVVVAMVVMLRQEFAPEPPVYKKCMPYLAAALGVVGALFLETVTIGDVVMAAAAFIYHMIRFKKPNATLIALLAGTIVGAIIMFVNPVYFSIADGSDPIAYRTVDFANIKSVYFGDFHYYLLFNNFILNVFMTGMLVWLFVRSYPSLKKSEFVTIIVCSVFEAVFLIESGSVYFGHSLVPGFPYFNYEGAVKGIMSFFFLISIIVETIVLLKASDVGLYSMFLLGGVLVYSLPMLIVTPISSRTMLCSYMLLASFTLTLLNENIAGKETAAIKRTIFAFTVAAAVMLTALSALYIAKYAEIYEAYWEREESVIEQLEEGTDVVVVKALPVTEYIGGREISFVRLPDPDSPYIEECFRNWYGISMDILVKVVK